MPLCLGCGIPTCAASQAAPGPCDCTDFLQTLRQAPNGTYNAPTYAALPATMRTNVTDDLIAAARKEQPAVVPPPGLNVAATALFNGGAIIPAVVGPPAVGAMFWYEVVDGTGATYSTQLVSLVRIYQNMQGQRANVLGHLETLSILAADEERRKLAVTSINICKDFTKAVNDVNAPRSKTADALANERHPLCRLYFIAVMGATSDRMTLDQIGLTTGRLDETTGKPSLNFKRLPDIETSHQLHTAIQDFKDAICVVGKNGARAAWAPFWEAVMSMMDSHNDPSYIHQLIFSALTDMEVRKKPIWEWFSNHWVTWLIIFTAKWSKDGENGRPSHNDPSGEAQGAGGSGQDGDYGSGGGGQGKGNPTHVKFGDVTQFFANGDVIACGEMRTKSGAVAFCNKWNERKVCTHGVFAGKHKGKCAYTHKCRWCMSTKHRAEDKHPAGHANAGDFVCSKHA